MTDFRKDFAILQDPKYIYFDNAATSQRPVQVLEAVNEVYNKANANPLRGLYEWSVLATDAYENARELTAKFIGAKSAQEIIFTRNATESLNLIAYSYGMTNVEEGDEILISVTEHHSNILPWQMVARAKHATLKFLEPAEDGSISEEEIRSKLSDRTKIFAMAQVSNVLGVTTDIKRAAQLAHEKGATVVIDGAQSAPHTKVDVQDLGADFFVFSGHKMLAPMGIGVCYGRKELLNAMPPFLTGGEMIEYVTRETATYAELPHKFEAGTVNVGGAVGLGAAINYLEQVGFDYIEAQEKKLTALLMEEMSQMDHLTVYGSADPTKHCGIVTFNIDGCHPHDVASILDEDHVCIRAGHHCAQPLLQYMNVGATCRASMYFYNTEDEVHRFAQILKNVRGALGYGS